MGLQGWTPDRDQEGLSCQQGPWSCPSWASQPATQGYVCVCTRQALLEEGWGRRGARGGGGNAQEQQLWLSGSALLSQLCDLGRSSNLSGPWLPLLKKPGVDPPIPPARSLHIKSLWGGGDNNVWSQDGHQ